MNSHLSLLFSDFLHAVKQRLRRLAKPDNFALAQLVETVPGLRLFTVETLGLKTLYVLFFIEHAARRVHPAG